MQFKLTDEQYGVLKWVIAVVLPAIITFSGTTMNAFNWQHTELFLTVSVAFQLMLGTIFKVSEYNYDKENEE